MLATPGLLGTLERTRLKEWHFSLLLARRLAYGKAHPEDVDIGIDNGRLEATYQRIVTGLRHLERDALAYRKEAGELIIANDAQKAWNRLAIGIRNAVMGIPSAAIPAIRNYLKDPDQLAEIKGILDGCCRDSLQNLSDTMPQPDT